MVKPLSQVVDIVLVIVKFIISVASDKIFRVLSEIYLKAAMFSEKVVSIHLQTFLKTVHHKAGYLNLRFLNHQSTLMDQIFSLIPILFIS